MGLPEAVIASYTDHRPHLSYPVSAETAARQQQTADLFYVRTSWCRKVDIRARIWQPAAAKERNHESEYVLVLPTHGDGRYQVPKREPVPVDYGYLQQIAQTADRLGFTGVLIPTGAHVKMHGWLRPR